MRDKKEMDAIVRSLLISYIDDRSNINFYDVYIVWKAKILQNWKYLLSTNIPEGRYYEITYDGNRKKFYIDEYLKINNTVIDWGEQK